MSVVRKLLFSLIAVVLFFGIAEGVLRAIAGDVDTSQAKFEHTTVYWVSDPNLDDEPMSHREMNTTFPVSTDRNGLRAADHRVDKDPNVFRIMMLGCSTTFGWGVKDDETVPAQLEQALRERGYDGVEVINAGQPGYTSFQGLWLWDKVLHEYDPDLVVLGFVVQDARRAAYSDLEQALLQGDQQFLKQNVLWNLALYRQLKATIDGIRVETKERDQTSGEGVFRVSEEDYLDHLRALSARAASGGAEVVLFGFPLERVGYTEVHRRLLRLEAEHAGVGHFDPSAELEAASRSETLYFERDRGHANAAGCKLIGQLFADYLAGSGLLPKA